MHVKTIVLFILCSFFSIGSVFAAPLASIVYQTPQNKDEAKIEKLLIDSGVVEAVTSFINHEIEISQPLYFKFGGTIGPSYDPMLNTVYIPYSFVEEVRGRFSDDEYSRNGISVIDATMNAVMHTMFHEFGHSIIFNYRLPIFGREEDAADSLASVLLLEYFEYGAEITINAADLFELESRDTDIYSEADFRGEHSLDVQRFYATLCHVYGSDPAKFVDLKQEYGFSDERADLCVEDYEGLLASWLNVLDPYLLKED